MLGAASERARLLYRVKPRPTVVAQSRDFFTIDKVVKNGYELNPHRNDFSVIILTMNICFKRRVTSKYHDYTRFPLIAFFANVTADPVVRMGILG